MESSAMIELVRKAESAADVHALAQEVVADPDLAVSLAESMTDEDPTVRAKAAGALELACRIVPVCAEKAHDQILRLLVADEPWVVRMNVARMAPLVVWGPEEKGVVVQFLVGEADGPNQFVAAWALDALGRMAADDVALLDIAMPRLLDAFQNGKGAIRTRARHRLNSLQRSR